MTMDSFVRLARTVARNARRYRTKRACELALARCRAAFHKAGSYGCVRHELDDAVAACQDRWQGLNGEEHDRRTAALLGAD
jgi:hypothetical protein